MQEKLTITVDPSIAVSPIQFEDMRFSNFLARIINKEDRIDTQITMDESKMDVDFFDMAKESFTGHHVEKINEWGINGIFISCNLDRSAIIDKLTVIDGELTLKY